MGKRYQKNPDQVVVVLANKDDGSHSHSLRLHITPTRATFICRTPMTFNHAATWTEWTRVSTHTIVTLAFPNGKLDVRMATRSPSRRYRLGWHTATHDPRMVLEVLQSMVHQTLPTTQVSWHATVRSGVMRDTLHWLHTVLLRGANQWGITLPDDAHEPVFENDALLDTDTRRMQRLMVMLAYPGLTSFMEDGYHFGRLTGGSEFHLRCPLMAPFRQATLPQIAKAALGNSGRYTVKLLGQSLAWNGSDLCLARATETYPPQSRRQVFYDPFTDEECVDQWPTARERGEYRRLNVWNLQVAMLGKGILPLDDLQAILAWTHPLGFENGTMEESTRTIQAVRRFLKGYSRVRVRQWLMELLETKQNWGELRDAAIMLEQFPEIGHPDARTVGEVHRLMTRNHQRRQRIEVMARTESGELKPFAHKPCLVPLNGTVIETPVGRYTFCLPHDDQDLLNWGEEANNCIGSYGDFLHRRAVLLVGFKNEAGRITYCLEISLSGQVRQWVGHCNATPRYDASPVPELFVWLKENGVAESLPYYMDPYQPFADV